MSLADRVSDLFHRTAKVPELSTSVVKHDRLDDGVLNDMVDRALHFRREVYDAPHIEPDDIEGADDLSAEEQAKLSGDYTAWEDLMGDTFRSLHTLDGPEVLGSDEIKPSRELNKRIIQQITTSEAFSSLRPETRHDEIASAFATLNLAPKLRETLTGELAEHVARVRRMEEQEQEIEDQQEVIDGMPDPNGQTPGQIKVLQGAAQAQHEAKQKLAQHQQQAQQAGMSPDAMKEIEKAVEEAQEDATAIASLPGTEPGSGVQLSPDQMIELAQKWKENHTMREIAVMLGRLQRDLRYKRTNRIIGGVEEIVDVKQGSELPLLMPHEKVKLMHPLMRKDFTRRFYEDDIQQYETQGYAEAGRGPIIICIDGSGSMSGMPNIWARAVSLALISIARREKRDAAAVEFSSAGQTKRWDFLAKEPMDPMKVLDFASHMFDGGTDITGGVELAKELIDVVPEFRTADIVIATDGHDRYQDDDKALKAELESRGVRMHGVAIGSEATSNAYLMAMCESVTSAWDLAGSNDATDHLVEAIS